AVEQPAQPRRRGRRPIGEDVRHDRAFRRSGGLGQPVAGLPVGQFAVVLRVGTRGQPARRGARAAYYAPRSVGPPPPPRRRPPLRRRSPRSPRVSRTTNCPTMVAT